MSTFAGSTIVLGLALLVFLSFQDDGHSSWAEATLAEMTLEEKVGQMFIAPARGYFTNSGYFTGTFDELAHQIENNHVGGFRLYGGEVVQTAALVNRLQSMSKVPLFFSSDVEAGLGREFVGGTEFPALMSVGASGSAEISYAMGRATAIEARAIGLNMVQSPVLDVNNNPQNPIINYRAFGEDPEEVARLGVAFIRGLQDHGVISTVKHFPGHGDTDIDSHIELPVVQHDRARLDSIELIPFTAAIQEEAGAIMVAHMGLPKVTGELLPATLSPAILEGLVRNELGYEGILITDALWMGGIVEQYSPGEAAILAIKAGNDILLSSPDLDEAFRAVIAAVRSGAIEEDRIDRSVLRILRAKEKLNLNVSVSTDGLFDTIGTADITDAAMEAAARGLTLVRNEEMAVPFQADEGMRVLNVVLSDRAVTDEVIGTITSEMEDRKLDHSRTLLTLHSDAGAFQQALQQARASQVVICHTFFRIRAHQGHVGLAPAMASFLRALQHGDAPVIIVSYGNPYLIAQMPAAGAYLTAFGTAPVVQKAVVRALLGEAPLTGTMPVSLPGYFERGEGIRTLQAAANK